MNAEILAIGSELLLGETVDTNSAYLARQLAAAGIGLFRKSVVGDNQARIVVAIREALERAELLICTGGLGPTVDDMTREAVAAALERPLEFRQELLDQVQARFDAMGRTMTASNRQQAYVPTGARAIENPRGTAPAFIVEDRRGTVIVLPGVPHEMRFLFEQAVRPYLRDERGQRGVILVRTLHAVGLGESVIGERIADLMQLSNPTLGISAKNARYELRIGAKADSHAEAEALIAPIEATIRERLGANLIGDEPIDRLVVRMLRERQETVALYEGVANAALYRAISAVTEGLAVLRGVIIHPLDRPADEEAATSLAHAGAISACDRWRSDYGVGLQVATQADERGFTTVCVVVVAPNATLKESRRFDLRQHEGWEFVGVMALDMLRRLMVG